MILRHLFVDHRDVDVAVAVEVTRVHRARGESRRDRTERWQNPCPRRPGRSADRPRSTVAAETRRHRRSAGHATAARPPRSNDPVEAFELVETRRHRSPACGPDGRAGGLNCRLRSVSRYSSTFQSARGESSIENPSAVRSVNTLTANAGRLGVGEIQVG